MVEYCNTATKKTGEILVNTVSIEMYTCTHSLHVGEVEYLIQIVPNQA